MHPRSVPWGGGPSACSRDDCGFREGPAAFAGGTRGAAGPSARGRPAVLQRVPPRGWAGREDWGAHHVDCVDLNSAQGPGAVSFRKVRLGWWRAARGDRGTDPAVRTTEWCSLGPGRGRRSGEEARPRSSRVLQVSRVTRRGAGTGGGGCLGTGKPASEGHRQFKLLPKQHAPPPAPGGGGER